MSTTDRRSKNSAAAGRLKAARLAAGYATASDAAEALSVSRDTYIQHENGTSPFPKKKAEVYAKKFRTTAEHLLFGSQERMGRIVGKVGANPDDTVIFSTGQDSWDYAPIPPGGSPDSVILEVEGHSFRGVADDGSLVYYDDRLTAPTRDMLNQLVVCELTTGQVVMKRLRKGSTKDVFDLESLNAPMMEDQKLVWVAHVTWIAPPHSARKIIRRSYEVA